MLSHHLHTNTYCDIETTAMFPFLDWWPKSDKHWIHRFVSPLYYNLIFMIVAPVEFIKRNSFILRGLAKFEPADLLVPLEFIMFSYLSPLPLLTRLGHFTALHVASGWWLSFTTLISTHHSPTVYHAGDNPDPDTDWGIRQLDTTRDVGAKSGETGSLFLLATTLGDHALHHLFPTVDQSKLYLLYPVFRQTLREFGVKYEFEPAVDMFVGMHKQMVRTETTTLEDRMALRAK